MSSLSPFSLCCRVLLFLLALDAFSFVNAALYLIKPSQGTTCHGGQSCTIEWLDDGESPLLSAIGVCTIGLYTGKQKIVQEIDPLDVSTTLSVTFTPNPEAGPNSDTYYIGITSTSLDVNGTAYIGFSPSFTLDEMSGSFSSPLASATHTISVPSSLTASTSSNRILSTITVGTLSTSLSPIPILSATTPLPSSSASASSSSSRFSTSLSSSASATSTAVSSSTSNSAAQSLSRPSCVFPVALLGLSLSLFLFL